MISNLVTKPTPKRYSSSPGAYKGFGINPGTSDEIAQQVRDIDSRISGPTTTPVPSKTTQATQGVSTTQPSTIKGLIPDPKSTLSYDRLVGSLADVSKPSQQQQDLNRSLVSASSPTKTQKGLITDLRGTAQGNFGIGQQAQRISDQYAPEIARVGGLGASAQAGYNSSGTNVVGAGNAAIASQSASQRMSALAAGQEAALKGNAQQLTAQEQAAGAFGTALGGANTQQAQQLSGLGTALGSANTQQAQAISGLGQAGSLAQPVQVAPGSTLFSPVTGAEVAGGLGGYTNYKTAEQVMGLISQYPDAQYIYNSEQSPQENLKAFQSTALQNSPTYQKSTYGQPGATSVVGGAQLTSASDLTQKSSEIQAIANGAEANFTLLVNTARAGGVNDTTVPVLNRLQQNVNRGLASADSVALFRATLESVRSQYASILGGGVASDMARSSANQQIPDDISLAALEALEKQLASEANNRVQGYQNQVNSLTNQAPAPSGGSGGLFDW